MKIGIIGTGTVGRALSTGLSAAGHEPVVGSRNPEVGDVGGVQVLTQRAVADDGDVVVLALPAGVAVSVGSDLREALAGKPVIDPANGYPTGSAGHAIAERVADATPKARLVGAFDTIGANRMTDPVVDGEAATMLIAGDDAVGVVGTLARELGFGSTVAGDLTAATRLEHPARFWSHHSREYGRDAGFRFLGDRAMAQKVAVSLTGFISGAVGV